MPHRATWKTSNFTIALHQKSKYPLTGAHIAVACNDCHKPMLGSPKALYHFKSVECTTATKTSITASLLTAWRRDRDFRQACWAAKPATRPRTGTI